MYLDKSTSLKPILFEVQSERKEKDPKGNSNQKLIKHIMISC